MPPVLTRSSANVLAKDFELMKVLGWTRIESLFGYLLDFHDFSMSTIPAGQGNTTVGGLGRLQQGLKYDQFVTWLCAVALLRRHAASDNEQARAPEVRIAWLLRWMSQQAPER